MAMQALSRTLVFALLAVALATAAMLPKRALAYDQRIALLIGLGEYESGQNKGVFRNLPIVANDLDAVGKALTKLGFRVLIYSDQQKPLGSSFEYLRLTALDAGSPRVSSQDVEDVVNNLLNKLHESGQNALLLVYYSGHGGVFGKADRVLVAPQSRSSSPSSFYRVRKLLIDMSDKAPATDKMLVVDACADDLKISGEAAGPKMEEELPTSLFSSRAGEPSFYDPNLRMSVFTHYFVDALTRAEELRLGYANGKIDSEGIRGYVYRVVPEHRSVTQKKLRPPGTANRVQRPYATDGKLLVLAEYGATPKTVPPPPNETDAEKEARLRALKETNYGSNR